MKTINHTPFTVEEIGGFPKLGLMRNNWRRRLVTLYAHPTDPALLVSAGRSFDDTQQVIVEELRSAYTLALAYATQGKVYIYD
jgi:hypothetical protein